MKCATRCNKSIIMLSNVVFTLILVSSIVNASEQSQKDTLNNHIRKLNPRNLKATTKIINGLIQSDPVTKFTCDTSFDELIILNVPNISLTTIQPQDPTDTNNEEPTKRRFFSFFCNFFRNIFRIRSSSSSSTLLSTTTATPNNRTLFFGTQQVSSNNQNPIVSVFDTNTKQQLWCYNTYEVAGADGRAIGALYVPSNNNTIMTTTSSNDELLYIVFTIDGTQGTENEDFRFYTKDGWISSYGNGGGPKVSIIMKINPSSGQPIMGTYMKSQLLSNGNTNTLIVKQISYETVCNAINSNNNNNDTAILRIQSDAYYLPISLDGTNPFTENDCLPDTSSPFNYTVTLSLSLTNAYSADCRRIDSPAPEQCS